MEKLNTWKALSQALCADNSGLTEEIELSIANPQKYFEKFEEELFGRGIEQPAGVSPWLALVDGLARRGYLHEFDCKFDAGEVVWQLERLQPCTKRGIDFSNLPENSQAVGEGLLSAAARLLGNNSLSLMSLDIDSDSYPVIPVLTDQVPPIQTLLAILGQQAKIL